MISLPINETVIANCMTTGYDKRTLRVHPANRAFSPLNITNC
jgi:hypothetical protein